MENKQDIRVRFAPSPTGPLHIGGARTALFNYLFARKNNGKLVLRIEDTDQDRSEEMFEQDIEDNLKWLGLNWDEKYRQSDRKDIYQKHLDTLIEKDLVYQKDGAYYFKTPTEGEVVVNDLIRGKVSFGADSFDDFVVVKSDGNFVFHFVNVIDDMEMKISHIIRGEDHLSNTPKHILLFEALEAPVPQYAHIPLILNEDRSKISKRTGDVHFAQYREKGYLPIGLINFLAQLGWSDSKGREFFLLEELINVFDLSRVQKAGAVFDIKYLNHMNHHYLNNMDFDEYYKLAKDFNPFEGEEDYHKKVLKLWQERVQYFAEIPELIDYFYQDPADYESKLLVFKKSSPDQTQKGLETAFNVLSSLDESSWSQTGLQQILDDTIAAEGCGAGDVFWPIRVALSGQQGSPSPVELLEVLGKDESIKRIATALKKLTPLELN
ncbi:MAG: glutamate--tRNA ligase [Patescibacteria group bacterium]|nr:glutamate--tRNA ligase [Patescibacteria group bacterium]